MTQTSVARPEHNLEGVTVLEDLDGESLRRVEEICAWRRYEPGEPIVEYLDRSDDVFFLVSGEARVILYSLAGRVVSFHDLSSGDMFGELPAFDGRARAASVDARTSFLVASIRSSVFLVLLQIHPSVLQAVLHQLVAMIRRLSTRVYEFSAAIMTITGQKLYGEMQNIRAKDIYPDEE